MKRTKKFLLCAMGTQGGDLNPIIGIAQELVRRGHRVIIATNGSHQQKIERLGLGYVRFRPALNDNEGATWFEYGLQSHLKEYRYLFRDLLLPHVAWNYQQLEKVVPDCDVLLCSNIGFPLPFIAKKLGKPWASCLAMPMGYEYTYHRIIGRTSSWDFLWLASLPPMLRSVILFLGRKTLHSWSAPLRELRQSLHLPDPRGLSFVEETLGSPYLNLALSSSLFVKEKEDWPQPLVQTGFSFYRQEKESLSQETREFLDRGEPPLVFTCGSMGYVTSKGEPFCKTVAEATRLMNKRAILIIGQGAKDPPDIPRDERLLIRAYEPFAHLIPHISTFAHLGGIGSLADGLYAGKPQLSIPFTYEQCDNALRLEKMGVSATIPIAQFNSARLCREIEWIEANACRERALEVQARIAKENGAEVAADHLEALL